MAMLSALGFTEPGAMQRNGGTYTSMPSVYNVPQIAPNYIEASSWTEGPFPGSPMWVFDKWKSAFDKVFKTETNQGDDGTIVQNTTIGGQDNFLLIAGLGIAAVYFAWPYVRKAVK